MEIIIFTGHGYEADMDDFIPKDEKGNSLGHFSVGMVVTEIEPHSNFFGKKMTIVGFDLEKEWIFFTIEGMPFAEIYEDNFENLKKVELDFPEQPTETSL